ncbi:hydroxyacid dehydrogenase [Rhizobacter sp. OV335]|uniref:hydroxyacid dehydrogenase n=1 Tax=Rhizobacter sp. OV335 TaxID=1500264 RepID=UPI000911305C|nr:hydroxyacid dehydrogenase [Rhizobacter sp. OV335]SHM37163.1 (S)-sulfolactate dehydrogenase [Rhizobacter sp. OV335]
MKILITEFMDAPAVARLAAKHEVVHDATLVDHPARMIALASSVDAIIVRNRTQVRGELLAALTRCKVVGRLGVGLDNLDMAGCEARGIRVIPATGANAQSVAEYVIATAMLLLRGAYGSTAEVAAGTWPRAALTNGREIGGKTLGLVGYGSIGQLTGRLARAVGMQVVAHDAAMPAGSDVPSLSLDALLAQADVVSLHVPLLDSTRHLINAQRLAAMKPGAVLINTARGGVVDEAALADALTAGRLAGAALDVFEAEPLPAGNPLADCPNLLLTPHIAGVTAEANERVSSLIAEKVLEALA